MGTALTEDQLRLLKRFTRRIVLALDADAAGEKATLRGLEMARQALDHTDELAFDARGLLRHEARLQADVRVTTLPPGMDPDEVVLRDPAEWAHILVEAAQPMVIHVMETLAAGRDLDDPKVKSEIAAQVLPLIEDVPNPVERDAYRQRLARLLRVDERALGQPAPARRPPAAARQAEGGTCSQARQAPGIAGWARPNGASPGATLPAPAAAPAGGTLDRLDRRCRKPDCSRFAAEDFDQTDHQTLAKPGASRLWSRISWSHAVHPGADLPERCALAGGTAQAAGQRVNRAPNGCWKICSARHAAAPLRVKESLNQLRYLQEELQEQGELTPERLTRTWSCNTPRPVTAWTVPCASPAWINHSRHAPFKNIQG